MTKKYYFYKFAYLNIEELSMNKIIFGVILFTKSLYSQNLVAHHDDCQVFSKYGINIKNISSTSRDFEVWRSSIGPLSKTPRHKHDTEEVFVFIEGKGKAIIGKEEIFF